MSRESHGHLEMVDRGQFDIICPYCDETCSDGDILNETSWEDCEFHEFECENCQSKFYVRENTLCNYDIAKGSEKQEIQDEMNDNLDVIPRIR